MSVTIIVHLPIQAEMISLCVTTVEKEFSWNIRKILRAEVPCSPCPGRTHLPDPGGRQGLLTPRDDSKVKNSFHLIIEFAWSAGGRKCGEVRQKLENEMNKCDSVKIS